MSANNMSGEEMFESLTGFEEIAISKNFGSEAVDLAGAKPTMFLRAMVFIAEKRGGKNDAEAKQVAMEMSLKDANAYFATEPGEPVPDEPETPQGKPDSPVAA